MAAAAVPSASKVADALSESFHSLYNAITLGMIASLGAFFFLLSFHPLFHLLFHIFFWSSALCIWKRRIVTNSLSPPQHSDGYIYFPERRPRVVDVKLAQVKAASSSQVGVWESSNGNVV